MDKMMKAFCSRLIGTFLVLLGPFSFGSPNEVLALPDRSGLEPTKYTTIRKLRSAGSTDIQYPIKVLIIADAFPNEITWTLFRQESNDDGDQFVPMLHGDAKSNSGMLDPGTYGFEMIDRVGDGLCCSFQLGSFLVKVNGQTAYRGGEFDFSTGLLVFTLFEDGTLQLPSSPGMRSPETPTNNTPTGVPVEVSPMIARPTTAPSPIVVPSPTIVLQTTEWSQIGEQLIGEDFRDLFGVSVALSSDGNFLVVGAEGNSGPNGPFSGHTRVFQNNGDMWNQLGGDIDGEAANDGSGFSVAISAGGRIVAIGAPFNGNENENGHVRVFRYNEQSETWAQLGQDLDGEGFGSLAGIDVALSADGMIVAVGESEHRDFIGQVRCYAFDQTTGEWGRLGGDIEGDSSDQLIGEGIDLSSDGTILAVFSTDFSFSTARVRVFMYDGSDWTQMGETIEEQGAVDEVEVATVELSGSGTVLAVSFFLNRVSVYEFDGDTTWNQRGQDLFAVDNSNFAGEDSYFGSSASLSEDGNVLAIGAPEGTISFVSVFEFDGTEWVPKGQVLIGENDSSGFGTSVSLSSNGDIVAVGAPFDDQDRGLVEVFGVDV